MIVISILVSIYANDGPKFGCFYTQWDLLDILLFITIANSKEKNVSIKFKVSATIVNWAVQAQPNTAHEKHGSIQTWPTIEMKNLLVKEGSNRVIFQICPYNLTITIHILK